MASATIDNPVKSIILTFIISLTVTLIMMNCFVLIGFGIVYQEDIGTAAGLAGTARLLFGAVATAIFSNVSGLCPVTNPLCSRFLGHESKICHSSGNESTQRCRRVQLLGRRCHRIDQCRSIEHRSRICCHRWRHARCTSSCYFGKPRGVSRRCPSVLLGCTRFWMHCCYCCVVHPQH